MSEPTNGAPAVSLIVVNYNGGAWLRRCVESLLPAADSARPSREIWLVDNASSDGSLEEARALARRHPSVTLIECDTNRGYAGAVNRALPRCRGRYVGILNMDLTAEPGFLGPLVDFLAAHPEAGAVNPLVALRDGRRVNAMGQDVHVTGLGFNRGLGLAIEAAGLEPVTVSGVQGAAIFMPRALLDRLGGMDDSGFLYHEDVNLSWILRAMGYELYCVPGSVVRHDYFLSMHPEKLYLLERNRWAMLLAYLSPLTLLVLAPMLLASELMLWGYALLKGPRFLAAKARSYLWLARHGDAIGARRRVAARLRTRGDWHVLRHMRWAYAWDQFGTLARERGPARER